MFNGFKTKKVSKKVEMNPIFNRLKKNKARLKSLSKQTEAYRLYDLDMPEFPFIIDRYKNYFVVYERGSNNVPDKVREESIKSVHESICELFNVTRNQIVFKERKQMKGSNQYTKQANIAPIEEFTVKEGDFKYWINLADYIDTGLFLDHRPLRKIVYDQSKEKKVLNLYSYTCAICVAAALGGATVTSVDLSNTYINWGKKNFELNNIEITDHAFIVADAMKYLEELNDQFDLIVLDPPTFSNSKKMNYVHDINKNYITLIQHCLRNLKEDGVLFFSNNSRTFKMEKEFFKNAFVKEMSSRTIPPDFKNRKIHQSFEIRHK